MERDTFEALNARLDFLEWLIRHPGASELLGDNNWFMAVKNHGGNTVFGDVRHRDGRSFVVGTRRTEKPIPALTEEAGREIAERWPEDPTGKEILWVLRGKSSVRVETVTKLS